MHKQLLSAVLFAVSFSCAFGASVAVGMRTLVNGRQTVETMVWTDDDGAVTLTRPAIPSGCEFAGWFGAGVTADKRTGETLSLTRTDAGSVYAAFRTTGTDASVHFVDFATGEDDDSTRDGHSLETAWQTIGYAVERAAAGSVIVMAKGTHTLSAATTVDKALTIRGDGENWETVLDGNNVECRFNISGDGILFHNLTFYRFGSAKSIPYAIDMTADATISNVVFTGTNEGRTPSYESHTVVQATTGLVTHCWFTNNVSRGNPAILLKGIATMENCYVAGNTKYRPYPDTQSGNGGIVDILNDNATVRNCTIVDNRVESWGALNIYGGGANLQNNIIWNNRRIDSEGQVSEELVNVSYVSWTSTSKFKGNCISPRYGTLANGNIDDDPKLESDRMHLKRHSPCRGAAVAAYVTATDIEGNPRGDTPSMGAFEYVNAGTLKVTLTPSATYVRQPETISFTVTVEGSSSGKLFYSWDMKPDGSLVSHEASPVLSEIGAYYPMLVVTNDVGETGSATVSEWLYVHTENKMSFYVDPTSGDDDNDGLSSAKSWKNLAAALRNAFPIAGDEIVVAAGTHTLTDKPVIDKAVTVRGSGENWETVLDGNFNDYCVDLAADGACLASLTLQHMGGANATPFAFCVTADATVSNVVVRGTNEGQALKEGHHLATASAGLVTHCWFTNNIAAGNVGISLTGTSKLENSYFAENTKPNATIYTRLGYAVIEIFSDNATMRNCTVVDNHLKDKVAVYVTAKAAIQNNLIWNNLLIDDSSLANYSFPDYCSTETIIGNCTSPLFGTAANGNVSSDPVLKDDRMHIKKTSSCNGAAVAAYATATDIEGTLRSETPSIGAFEYVDTGSIEVSVSKSATFARLPDGIALTCSVTGSYKLPLSYVWDYNDNGTTNSTEAAPTITTVGIFQPRLTVTDADGLTATAVFEETLTVHEAGASLYYVSDEIGDDANTGLDPLAPMKTIRNALVSTLVVDGDTVELAKGTHVPSDKAIVSKAVVVRGAGAPEETVIDGATYGGSPCFTITASGAKVCNLTLSRWGGIWSGCYGVSMTGSSVVSNVIVRNCMADKKPTDSGNAGNVIYAEDGLVTHCVITNNRSWGNAGVVLAATTGAKLPRMENCLIADNWNFNKSGVYYYGIVELNTRNTTCVPKMFNCTIVSNRTNGRAALELRDAQVYATWSRPPVLANNVVWGNLNVDTDEIFDWQVNSPNGRMTSEALTSNMTANCVGTIDGISGTNNIALNPLFSAKVPYHLNTGSPCQNAGDNSYVTSATDLDGNPRRFGARKRVDMGCYEIQRGNGLAILVR